MYVEGSNALKTEYFTYDVPSGDSAKKVHKTSVSKNSRKKVRVIKKRVVAGMVLMFAMAFTVLFRYAAITQEYNHLTDARSRLDLINAKVVETQVQAEGNMDPKRVEQEAARLGLKPPAKNQIKYISLGNTDNGEVLKTEETNMLTAFINRVSVILEYLY